ncbi:BisC Anaerobic dehydrogenases, typically selenocysteine-containing [Acidimicrobiia bacterium]
MTTKHRTYCRLCEAGCGIVAEVSDDGTVQQIRPDNDHPVTAGFACNKGLLCGEIHHDPDRVNHPQRKTGDTHERATWDDANTDIAARMNAIIAEHGPDAIAGYIGNPAAFNATAGPALALFVAMFGSTSLFTTGSQDCSNKFAVGEMLWGSPQIHLIADVDNTDHMLLFGTNPRISKGSFLAMPDPIGRLGAIEKRGGTVRFIDPRRIEPNVGEIVQVKPDTDVYLLAAMLHEIDVRRGFDVDGSARVTALDSLREFLQLFPAERVAPVVGIDTEQIVQLALEFADSPTASVHMSTGVNMGRQGALAYWLMHLLSLLTGNFDCVGGNIPSARGTDPAPGTIDPGPESFVDSPWGPYRRTVSSHPGALLIDMIRDGAVRALFVAAGNPALTMGGGPELAEALESLDLLVTVDMYRNATGELADWVLPATDWFEREDLNTFVQGTQLTPYVQWAGPIVEPIGERRTERRIFTDIAEAAGAPVMFGNDVDMLAIINDAALDRHGLSMAKLREHPDGIAVLEQVTPGGFLDAMRPGGMFDGDPAMMTTAKARAIQLFEELESEPSGTLKLITRRTAHTINSALQNVEKLKAKGAADNPLYMASVDAVRLSLVDGSAVCVSNRWGSVESTIRIDDTLRDGVVAMTHGFGNAGTTGMPAARRHPGVNVNALAPTGPGTFDPVSTMSQLTGIPVEVTPL